MKRSPGRRIVSIGIIALACLGMPSVKSGAQVTEQSGGEVSSKRPFFVGERLTYSVRVGPLGRGTAVAEIAKLDTLRGQPVYYSRFKVDGSLLFFTVNDLYESWFTPSSLVSLRYHQKIDQGPYERNRTYEIYPNLGIYVESGKPEAKTVDRPLDDGAFLYFLRTIPLDVGRTYTFNRYFKPDRNPVRVTVVRRERIKVPAGEFDAVVLQPKIKAKGIFAENANAEVWIADDDGRIMLQMKTHLQFGAVTFQLRSRENLKTKLAEKN